MKVINFFGVLADGETLGGEGLTGGKKVQQYGGAHKNYQRLHGVAGDEDIYKILGNVRPPKVPTSGRRQAEHITARDGIDLGMSRSIMKGEEGSPLASGYKSSYDSFFERSMKSKRPAPNPGEVGLAPPQPPVEPLSSSQIEAGLESDRQNLKSVAVNPNNPGYSSVENYSPYKNQVLTDYTKRNHWLDREHRKHRDPVLPWGSADPFLHNNPGSGGDNAELRVQKNQRDRGLALAQHQVGYRRS
mmetsp:Transcript_11754/g.22363  ORF Transcript_11754/g.22363 Transcript_11754/m.22363 type:complete len:245 (-) Transcript_11754:78-812(-)